ncbi:MAG: SLC13 family permease, partial [Pseudomonadota bacterium]
MSAFVVGFLLVFFTVFPLEGPEGENLLDAPHLLLGFASPALFAIMGLLIVGQGMYQSGALDYPTQVLVKAHARFRQYAVVAVFVFVMAVSAFLNNTPVVVMFVPIMAAVAAQGGIATSRLMMPLSFMSILGGMLTTIGSSTNLLAVEAYEYSTGDSLSFFALAPLGLVLAAAGSIYLAFATKYFLPDRYGEGQKTPDGRQFLAQLSLDRGNPLIGEKSVAGLFPSLKDVTVRLVQRREETFLPPFDDLTLRLHDKVVVAATRDALTKLLKTREEILAGFLSEVETLEGGAGELTMVESVVAPGSRIIGRSISQIRFRFQTNCIILGIQRRSRMIRTDLSSIRLEAGDV